MNHNSDPIDRLKAADPASAPGAVSDPYSPTARAILEEVLAMPTETTTDRPVPTPAATPTPTPWWKQRIAIGAAAAAFVLVAGIGAAALGGGDSSSPNEDNAALPIYNGPEQPDQETDLFPGGEPNGSQITSCVELYSPETLANRGYAFDGTIESIAEDGTTTFTVHEWFRGGEGTTVTKDGSNMNHSILDPTTSTEFAPGTRVLVSGEDEFVWTCGFSQQYSPALADEWRGILAG